MDILLDSPSVPNIIYYAGFYYGVTLCFINVAKGQVISVKASKINEGKIKEKCYSNTSGKHKRYFKKTMPRYEIRLKS